MQQPAVASLAEVARPHNKGLKVELANLFCQEPIPSPDADAPCWLSVTETAKLLAQDLPWLNPTKAKARVSTAANRGEFVTNKKKGRDRRVQMDSFSTWRIKQRNRGLDAEDSEA